ncbi:MAG: hypothetical protein P8182_19340, partial [Deltaproteobacteria bacterium]
MEELRTILDDCTVDVEVNVRDKIVNRFENIQKVMSKRFLRTMRLWTIAWALPVAFYFQISAPAVLTNFLNDAELQARAVQMATDLQGQAQATLGRQPTYEDGSAKALRRLIEKHPKYRVVFKEASKGEEDKGDIVANLAQALKDDPHGQESVCVPEDGPRSFHGFSRARRRRGTLGGKREAYSRGPVLLSY